MVISIETIVEVIILELESEVIRPLYCVYLLHLFEFSLSLDGEGKAMEIRSAHFFHFVN